MLSKLIKQRKAELIVFRNLLIRIQADWMFMVLNSFELADNTKFFHCALSEKQFSTQLKNIPGRYIWLLGGLEEKAI